MSRITVTAPLSVQGLDPVLAEPLGLARQLIRAGEPLKFSVGRGRNSTSESRPATVANATEWALRHLYSGRVERDKIEAFIHAARTITPLGRNARASWRSVFEDMADDILAASLGRVAAAMVTELLRRPKDAQTELVRRRRPRRHLPG